MLHVYCNLHGRLVSMMILAAMSMVTVLVSASDADYTTSKSCSNDDASNCYNDWYNNVMEQIRLANSTQATPSTLSHRYHDYYQLIQHQWTQHPTDVSAESLLFKSCATPFDHVIYNDLLSWRQKGGISREDFDAAKQSGVHYQVFGGKLYRQEKCLFGMRCKGVEHHLLKIIDTLPNTEFIINVHDWPKSQKHLPPKPILSFSKDNRHYDIMYPAWTFWCGGPAIATEPMGLGRWDLKRESLTKSALNWPWEAKEQRGFFRGSRTSSERDPLVLLSRHKPHVMDAAYTKNQAWKSKEDTLNADPAVIVTLEEHCKFKYLFNFRGVAASFRYKHLFLCRSLVFQADSKWVEFFYDSLVPWVHYVPVASDASNAEELIGFMMANDKIARAIAERGYHYIWENLTPDNILCYWRNLILEYTKLIQWTPEKIEQYLTFN